jgi:hypothetical protein
MDMAANLSRSIHNESLFYGSIRQQNLATVIIMNGYFTYMAEGPGKSINNG